MKNKLAKILEGAVAIPYSEEMLSQLVSICRSYSEDDLYAKVDNCSLSFITGNIDDDFSYFVVDALDEKKSELISLPTNVLARLSLFSVYLTVTEEDDELKQHLYATMFMNAMILAKGRWDTLSNDGVIKEIYNYHIANYLSDHDITGDEIKSSIISKIADDPTYYKEHGFDDIELSDLQTLAKDAACFRCEKMLNNQKLLNIADPFKRVYSFITKLVESYQYLYYDYDILEYITDCIKNVQKNKMLSNILKDLGEYLKPLNTHTSVILRMLQDDKIEGSDFLLQKRMTAKEFGIYLYYELLVERMIEN